MARWTRFRRLFGLEPKADVDAELAFHVDMRIRELIDQGETPERARDLALQRFGDYARARQECVTINERRRKHMHRTEFITELRQDIGYAFRMLRRTPERTNVSWDGRGEHPYATSSNTDLEFEFLSFQF